MKCIVFFFLVLPFSCNLVVIKPLKLPVPSSPVFSAFTKKISPYLDIPAGDIDLTVTVDALEEIPEQLYPIRVTMNDSNRGIYYLTMEKNPSVYPLFSRLKGKEIAISVRETESKKKFDIRNPSNTDFICMGLIVTSFSIESDTIIDEFELGTDHITIILVKKVAVFETEEDEGANLIMKFHYPISLLVNKSRTTLYPGEGKEFTQYIFHHLDTYEVKTEEDETGETVSSLFISSSRY